jgi:hypothetical protein
MKDLVGKIAVIEAPTLFQGQRECTGFEYNEAGTMVRWKEMPSDVKDGVPVGLLSVIGTPRNAELGTRNAEQKAQPIRLVDVPEDVKREIVAGVQESVQGMIAKERAELEKREAEMRREIEARVRAELVGSAGGPAPVPPSAPTTSAEQQLRPTTPAATAVETKGKK